MAKQGKEKAPGRDELSMLRHDIRNQLSSIQLALEELRYEFPDPSADIKFCIDTISISCDNIMKLLKPNG